MSIRTKVITVTPEDAERYLSNMVNNRKVKARRITKLAGSMKRGDWGLTGQPLVFSPNGKMLDGQHRMRAVIASGRTIQFLAVYGVDESMYSKMDDVAPRGVADGLIGVANANEVASALRCLHCEQRSAKGSLIHPRNYPITTDESIRLMDTCPGIIDAASFVVGRKRVRAMIGGGVAAYSLYRMRSDSEVMADAFMEKMHTGEGLSARSPVLSLRNVLMDGRRNHGIVSGWPTEDRICMLAFAWHAHLDRKSIGVTAQKARAAWKGWRTDL
jgi:hypothetical protein